MTIIVFFLFATTIFLLLENHSPFMVKKANNIEWALLTLSPSLKVRITTSFPEPTVD